MVQALSKKKYTGGCVVPSELAIFAIELFDVRNPAESGNKNGCQIITKLSKSNWLPVITGVTP
jgi:hypothetical protein